MIWLRQWIAIESHLKFTRKDNSAFQPRLRKILGIEGNHKVCLAGFGAEAKRVVLGVGRNLSRGMYLHLFGPFADQVDDLSDHV